MDLAGLSRKLLQTTQGDVTLKEETATALQQFIADPKETRAGIMCIVDAIRIFAPEPPIPIDDLPKVFRLVIQQLWLVHDPVRIRFAEAMVQKLYAVNGHLLFLHTRECMLAEVFATIFEVFATPFDESIAPKLVPGVVKMMLSLMNEASCIPPEVLHKIFHHLEGNTFLRRFSRSLLHGLDEHAVEQVKDFVESEWLAERGDAHGIAQHALIRIFEAYKINPNLVGSIMPRLEDELRRIDPVRRIAATELVGKMAALPQGDIATDSPLVWQAYIERFDDVVNDVRHACTRRVCGLVQNHPSASSTARVLDRCQARLVDKSKSVRLEMIWNVNALFCNPPEGVDFERIKKFLPSLFRRCRDKHHEVRAAALSVSVTIYLAHRGESFVEEVPSHVFTSLFLCRGEKQTRIVEECAERLFQPTNNGVPACIYAFRGESGGLDEVAQNGLVSFSQTKTLARRALLRLLNVHEQLIEPTREASAALARFRTFCPAVAEGTILDFLAGTVEEVREWASVRRRLTVAEAQRLWNSIVQHLKGVKTVTAKSALPHVIRLSGAHLFAASDEIARVLECETATNMLSLAAPHCLIWHVPQLCVREGLFALQRLAKHVEIEDVTPLAIELPPTFGDKVVSFILGGQVDAVGCLVFASIATQDAAKKQLVDVCLHEGPLHPKGSANIAYRLRLATALLASFLLIDDETKARFVTLALDHVANHPEASWSLLGECGCLRELLAHSTPRDPVLPMLLNAMTKHEIPVAALQAIRIMGVMVHEPHRHKFLKDINLLLWKTNWKPTFALILILSVFGLNDKTARAEALSILVGLLQHLQKPELPNVIIGFIAAVAESAPQKPQMASIAAFFAQAYVDAKKDGTLALEACRRAGDKVGLRVAADIVFVCFENAFERANAMLDSRK